MNSLCKQAKLDYRKNSIKKKKTPKKVFKKKNPKATKKPKVGSNLSSVLIAKTPNITTNCTCPADFTSFVIATNIQCFRYDSKGPLSLAVSTCAKDGARLPLPKSARENADLLAYFLSKKNSTQYEFALDLSDAQTEGDFMSSISQKINYTNWRTQKPENKTADQDFATMQSDGRWNMYDGNYMTNAIICQTDCQLCK